MVRSIWSYEQPPVKPIFLGEFSHPKEWQVGKGQAERRAKPMAIIN